MGPGKYFIPREFERFPNKGVCWYKSKVRRASPIAKQTGIRLGPGTYNPKRETVPLYKFKQSSVFHSNSMRGINGLMVKKSNLRERRGRKSKSPDYR